MSIAIRMMGGVGNLLFQIATGETWRRRGYDVVYTQMDENLNYIAHNYVPRRHSEDYKMLFDNFNWDKHKAPPNTSFKQIHVPYIYTEIELRDGCEYIGYFQSDKNFSDGKFVRWLFLPSEMVKSLLAFPIAEYSCSIHVRRQDYLNLKDYHTNLGMDYYNDAIDALDEFRIDKFYIFSDDIDWCRKVFIGDQFEFMTCLEYVSLYLMGMCTHNIIANSSLSWWGAFLPSNSGRMVIGPKDWFGPKGQNSKDLMPKYWIKI